MRSDGEEGKEKKIILTPGSNNILFETKEQAKEIRVQKREKKKNNTQNGQQHNNATANKYHWTQHTVEHGARIPMNKRK